MPDNLSPEHRRKAMSRVKQKDTDLELIIRSALRKKGYRFRQNVKSLPGKPDIVFASARVVVFIDGDFWHGYRFPSWRHKLTEFWQTKINRNRERDQRNFKKLRKMNWQVIRIWQHQIKRDVESCICRIVMALENKRNDNSESRTSSAFTVTAYQRNRGTNHK